MDNTFDPALSDVLHKTLGLTTMTKPAPPPVPKPGHVAVQARNGNVLRVQFGR